MDKKKLDVDLKAIIEQSNYILMPKTHIKLSIFVFISLSIALLVYWLGYGRPSYGIDDANIYLVYMRNLATGHGFVWNVSGERVEGFTSVLWTLIGSLFYKIGGEKYYLWLLLLLNYPSLTSFYTLQCKKA